MIRTMGVCTLMLLSSWCVLSGAGRCVAQPTEAIGDAAYASYVAHMAAAGSALRLHETGDALRWLHSAPGDHTQWEWRLLDGRCDSSVRTWRTEAWLPVGIDFAPDGKSLAVAGDDGVVRVVQSDDWSSLREFRAGQQAVYAARFSPDGTRIATCARDGTLALWQANSGDKLWEQVSGGQGLADVAFQPDGRRLAFCSWYRGPSTVLGIVSLWDTDTGERQWQTEFGVKPIVVVRFSPDGSKLAVGTWDALVGIWDTASLGEPTTLDFRDVANYSAVDDIAFSHDSRRLAAASKNGSPRLWNLESHRIERDLQGHTGAVFATAFTEDDTHLITGGTDGVVGLWDVATGRLEHRFWGHEGRIRGLAVRPGSGEFVTGSADGTLRAWSLARTGLFVAPGQSVYRYGLAVSHDGGLVATGGQQPSEVTVWHAAARQVAHTLRGMEGTINYLDFGPDDLLVGGNWLGDVWVWRAGAGTELLRLEKQDQGGMRQCAFSSDGKWIAATTSKETLAIWDAQHGSLIQRIPLESGGWGVDFSPDARQLAVGDGTGHVHVLEAGTWQETLNLPGQAAQINAVRFSPDGNALACGNDSGLLAVYDVPTRGERWKASAHSQRVWTLDFLPDGSRLATGGADQKVRVWDTQTGHCVLTLDGLPASVYNVAFAPSQALYVNGMVATQVMEPRASP